MEGGRRKDAPSLPIGALPRGHAVVASDAPAGPANLASTASGPGLASRRRSRSPAATRSVRAVGALPPKIARAHASSSLAPVAPLPSRGGGDNEVSVCLVSVCDGIGGGRVAVGSYTNQVSLFVVEPEATLRDFVSEAFPGAVAHHSAENLDIDSILRFTRAANADVTLLLGRTPGPHINGPAQDPHRLDGDLCAAFHTFVSLRDRLQADVSRADGRVFHWLLEGTASVSVARRRQISDLVGCEPVLVNAADWGWVQRSRLYWGLDLARLSSHGSAEVIPPGVAAESLTVVRYTGPPVPADWQPNDGDVWTFRDEIGRRSMVPPGTGYSSTYADGRFLAFTAILPYPADRPPRAVAEDRHVYQRYVADGRMQPISTYVRGNMLERADGGGMRQLTASEREVLMGFPPGYSAQLRSAAGSGLTGEHARRHAISTSFHVPSIVLLL